MRLRQVATVARQLAPVVDHFRAVLGIEVAYRDPSVAEFGLHNAVMPVGDTFLEVVSPRQDGTTAGRFLERQGGDAGYMVILQTEESMDAFRRRMKRLGVRVIWTADHPDMRGTHLHPKDVGGAILSVDWAKPPGSWRWAGPDWRARVRTDVAREIIGVEMRSKDPEGMARRWGQLLQRPTVARAEKHWVIELDRGRLTFAPALAGGPQGVTAFEVDCAEPQRALDAAARRGLVVHGNRAQVGGVEVVVTAPVALDAPPPPGRSRAAAR